MYVYVNAHACIGALYNLYFPSCVCVCNIVTYMHTRMISFLFIMLCKFVNKLYIISHDMQKNMVSERGGGADKKKTNKQKKNTQKKQQKTTNKIKTKQNQKKKKKKKKKKLQFRWLKTTDHAFKVRIVNI